MLLRTAIRRLLSKPNLKQIKNRAINILRGKYGEDFVTD